MRNDSGITLVELLVASALALGLFLTVMAAYSQGNLLAEHVQGSAKVQDNVRVAMHNFTRHVRMAGAGVPTGDQIGGSQSWMPFIFHASPTELGFRADIDHGGAEIICTPHSSNSDCPLEKLRLDSLSYYSDLNCRTPDGSGDQIPLVAVSWDETWLGRDCDGFDARDSSITVARLPSATFLSGRSRVATIEQIYFYYVPRSTRPWGTLIRNIEYTNVPTDSFPGPGSGVGIATQLTDFWLEYQDAYGTVLAGNPLSAAQREAVRKIVVFIEGYDQVGPDGPPKLLRSRSEILIRNSPS